MAKPDQPETLRSLVTARLDEKSWTLGTLAEKAKISRAGLRKLMSGQVADARGPTVGAIAKALGVDPARVRLAIEASRAAAE